MAGEDPYLPPHAGYLDPLDAFREDTMWMPMDPTFQPMQHSNALRAVDAPYLQIVEQPKQRGFRFRYGCEGPSHGGLPGASSEKNRKSYPQVKICNYQGAARVVVQLVTNTQEPHLHAHSLVGKQCDKGICIADLQPKDSSISFPNLGILHVTKKNVSKILEERMVEAYRMGYNCGVYIHPDIDNLQGEVRMPRELTDHERSLICSTAIQQSKEMDLSVVRLMFTAFLPDSDGGFSRRLDPVISEPIFDSKAPNASNLKIVRMDRTAGCVTGGEEVYLLCDKVQKDDIQVRFYEDDDTGSIWEAYGDFSPTDVHRQFAIVFKTPKYRDQNLQKPISVFVQLKRKSDNETSEPKPFTYHPQIIDKEEVQRKRQKTLPHFPDYSGAGGGAGGMFRGGGGPTTGGGPSGGGSGGHFYQGYQTYNNYGSGYNFSPGMGGGGTSIKQSPQEPVEDSDEDSNGDNDDYPAAGGVMRICGQPESVKSENTELPIEYLESDMTECAIDPHLAELAKKQAEALFYYALSGDPRMLLAPQRPLMTTQDENGDTGLHLGVIHSQTDAVRNLAQVIFVLPGEDVLNMRNDLYQTPLHLAVVTQQKEVVEALLEADVDVTLTDRNGNTALHLAAQHKEGNVLRLLLKHNSAARLTGVPNTAGLCPLHLAVRANSLGCMRALLEAGVDVEVQELTCGRTALHLATEMDNLSLAGCLLLEGNANVDSVTYNGSTPLHIAAGRGSTKLTALLMAAGADPHKENFEPLFFKDDETFTTCDDDEEEDEGYIPGTTPINMAASVEVYDILNGQEYQPTTVVVPPQGDMSSLSCETKQDLCQALEEQTGGWESLAHALGLGILTSAFKLSSCPAGKLLDSYEVSGGTVRDLIEGLKQVGNSCAVSLLQAVCKEAETTPPQLTGPELCKAIQGLTLGSQREESGICDSGVETSF
ncbi:nuclear factor NF-kappa-B p105 subunit [Misgurnus anguillicaudatus]|uniref:nuclear factor NF-kappa-B p105 subunit n=1 Tax=Misgurnus anguillicaudatus TaxID=75329 RepID=UPI003CCFA6C4